jgi:hypothetical protein
MYASSLALHGGQPEVAVGQPLTQLDYPARRGRTTNPYWPQQYWRISSELSLESNE